MTNRHIKYSMQNHTMSKYSPSSSFFSKNVFVQMCALSLNSPNSSSFVDNSYSNTTATTKVQADDNDAREKQHKNPNNVAATTITITEKGENNKTMNYVQSKLCLRGHWRPAEDFKLKELITLYGPHNWNLIAKKLQGRSGFSLQARDSSHVGLVALLLRSEGFEHYRRDRNISTRMNLSNMAKMLKCVGNDDIITLKNDDPNDDIII